MATDLREALLSSAYDRFHDLREPGCPPQPLPLDSLDAVAAGPTGPDDFTDLLIL